MVAVLDQTTGRIRTDHAAALAAGSALVVAVASSAGRGSFSTALVGAAIWTTTFSALALVGTTGGGDFKYATTLGLTTGWGSLQTTTLALLVAVIAAGVIAIITAVRQRTMRAQVRLGIPMFVGAAVAVITTAI